MGYQWAEWSIIPPFDTGPKTWKLGGNYSFSAQFRPLALRAARELNPGSPSLETWLDALEEVAPPEDCKVSIQPSRRLPDGQEIEPVGGAVGNLCEISADLCNIHEAQSLELENSETPSVPTKEQRGKAVSPKVLRDTYISELTGPKIKILDICWAAGQHYSEWKRWLRNALKDGSTPDLAFRTLLTSGKRPDEYRKQPRPDGWK